MPPLQKPQLRASGVGSGLVAALQANLEDASLMVRAHTADAIEVLAKHPLGTAAIVAAGTHAELIKLIDDSEATVRTSAYKALLAIATTVAGAPGGRGWSGNTMDSGGGGSSSASCATSAPHTASSSAKRDRSAARSSGVSCAGICACWSRLHSR